MTVLKPGVSLLEELLAVHLDDLNCPVPVRHYHFCADRRYEADFAWPDFRIIVEVEGWGHRTGKRYQQDVEKYNTATYLGWRVYRVTSSMVNDGSAAKDIMRFMGLGGGCET